MKTGEDEGRVHGDAFHRFVFRTAVASLPRSLTVSVVPGSKRNRGIPQNSLPGPGRNRVVPVCRCPLEFGRVTRLAVGRAGGENPWH